MSEEKWTETIKWDVVEKVEVTWNTAWGLSCDLKRAGVPSHHDDELVEIGDDDDICWGSPHARPDDQDSPKRWTTYLPDGRRFETDAVSLVRYAAAWADADDDIRSRLLRMGEEADHARQIITERNRAIADRLLSMDKYEDEAPSPFEINFETLSDATVRDDADNEAIDEDKAQRPEEQEVAE